MKKVYLIMLYIFFITGCSDNTQKKVLSEIYKEVSPEFKCWTKTVEDVQDIITSKVKSDTKITTLENLDVKKCSLKVRLAYSDFLDQVKKVDKLKEQYDSKWFLSGVTEKELNNEGKILKEKLIFLINSEKSY